jgi:hypothetical protein
MNILMAFIPFIFNCFTQNCDCEKYYPLLEQAENAQVVFVGEILSFEDPYYLEGEEPLNPGSPNRNSAVMVKVVQLVKGKLRGQKIKVLGYSYFAEKLSKEQPYRLGFEYAKVGAKYLFCIDQENIPVKDIPENAKLKLDYELKCCGASFLPINEKNHVVGKIENPDTIIAKSLDWVLSQIVP